MTKKDRWELIQAKGLIAEIANTTKEKETARLANLAQEHLTNIKA